MKNQTWLKIMHEIVFVVAILVVLVTYGTCKHDAKQNEVHPDSNKDITYNIGGVDFKLKRIDAIQDVMLGDNTRDDNKEHKVSLSSYYIGETEVTQELWLAVMKTNPSNFKGSLKLPVEQVSWFDCIKFCNELTVQVMGQEHCVYEGQDASIKADFSKKGFRLPTEAEWEVAAMGGLSQKYAGCNDDNELALYAWYEGNADGKTHDVGAKKANKYGLYDMSGNVWEWVFDWYDINTPSEGKDPVGVPSGDDRVSRGGSYLNYVAECSRAYRACEAPQVNYPSFGLRLACRP